GNVLAYTLWHMVDACKRLAACIPKHGEQALLLGTQLCAAIDIKTNKKPDDPKQREYAERYKYLDEGEPARPYTLGHSGGPAFIEFDKHRCRQRVTFLFTKLFFNES